MLTTPKRTDDDSAKVTCDRYAASGYIGAMREYAKTLEHMHTTKQMFTSINIAAAYAALGEKGRPDSLKAVRDILWDSWV